MEERGGGEEWKGHKVIEYIKKKWMKGLIDERSKCTERNEK